MEEATTEQIQNNQEISPGDEKKGNDQQEVNYINGHGEKQLKIVHKKELGVKSEIKEVQDGDPHTDTKELSGNGNVKEKFEKKRVKGDPTMTLIPQKCDEKSIEYEVKYKGTSKPFSKVRAILTHELKEKGEAALHWMRHGSPGAKEAKKEYKLEIFTWSSLVGAPNEVEQPSAFFSSRYF
ncbi:hypothetical protein F2Q70_00011633 [Brassica cretica]|uniref:Uncharacterized protein n=1 Tax=Brassica cretica TaxID=69181 RepID=A0A8S9M206_BRACR|nr:hypothetical protein F2Q70_00011633 [Brassica cretica]